MDKQSDALKKIMAAIKKRKDNMSPEEKEELLKYYNSRKHKLRSICYDVMNELDKKKSEIKVDLRGHNGTSDGEREKKDLIRSLTFIDERCLPTQKQLRSLKSAVKSGKPTKAPITIREMTRDICHVCDEPVTYSFDGVTFRAQSKCKFSGGMPEYSIDLAVPSGKLVVANDLRNLFDNEYQEIDLRPSSRGWGFNINTDMGSRQVFEAYGELGMAHGYVGNSCPGMFRVDKNTLTLSMVKYDEETDDYVKGEEPGECVGGVCTDLWWYSVVDYDNYVRRAGEEPGKWCNVVDVKPGMYKVTHRAHTFDRNANATEHYAMFKWQRKLTKKDLIIKETSPIITTVEDTIKASLIFGECLYKTRAAVLDHFFFTIGTGSNWKNGCIISNMNPRLLLDNIDNSNFKPPKDLKKRMKDINIKYTYPISSYSAVCNIPDNVRDDWLAAAFEALDMAIAVDPDYKSSAGYKNSDMIKKAKKIKKSLEKRFKGRLEDM
jgi:hypothetical protein